MRDFIIYQDLENSWWKNIQISGYDRPRVVEANTIQRHSDFWQWLFTRKGFRTAISQNGYYEFRKGGAIAQFSRRTPKKQGHLVPRYLRKDGATTRGTTRAHFVPAAFQRSKKVGLDNNDNSFSSGYGSFYAERFSSTPRILVDNQLYSMKIGYDNCAVFDMKEFYPPYLTLRGFSSGLEFPSGTEELPIKLPGGYKDLTRLFRQQWNEHTFIKALHFCGAFGSLVECLTRRTKSYVLGPSGPITSRFPFWMKNSKNRKLFPFVHEGTVDMDECLVAGDDRTVIPIEAKPRHFPDLSWHKLAFPCYRFISQPSNPVEWLPSSAKPETDLDELNWRQQRWKSIFSMDPLDFHIRHLQYRKRPKIIPVYCTCFKNYDSWRRGAILYAFPEAQIHTGQVHSLSTKVMVSGIVLNYRKQMAPTHIFKVDLSWLRDM